MIKKVGKDNFDEDELRGWEHEVEEEENNGNMLKLLQKKMALP